MSRTHLRFFFFLLVACAGCAECAPERVGEGTARLTVVSAATVLRMIEADDRCGFASAIEPEIEGEPGQIGEARWRIQGCRIARHQPEIRTSCTEEITTISGAFEVSATKTVRGLLTGDPDRPVIPADASAVTIRVERARFDRFRVVKEGAPGDLELISGDLSFVGSVRLASDQSGVCSVPTQNVSIDDLRHHGAIARITTPDRSFEVEIPRSHLEAVIGDLGDGRRNSINGAITVWDKTVAIPAQPLDEEYDPVRWIEGYACDERLAQPITFECVPPRARIAEGAAKLTARLLGALATLANADERCGFSTAVPRVDGTPGYDGGASIGEISGCELEFPRPMEVSIDCFGTATMVEGRAIVSGVRAVEGWVTGDPSNPIIPGARHAVAIALDAELSEFAAWKEPGDQRITASGRISAIVEPSLAIDRSSGACSVPTPNVTFSEVRWFDAQLRLESGGISIAVPIEGSLFEAQNGVRGARDNYVRGEITAFGERFEIDAPLDPTFDRTAFEESYRCDPDLILPERDEDCAAGETLAINAARLLIVATGSILRASNENADCGFSAPDLEPEIEGEALDDDATMTLAIAGCEVAPNETVDCIGERTRLFGSIRVDATRTVTGLRAGIPVVLPLDLVIPRVPDAVDVIIERAMLDQAVLEVPQATASFASGEISAVVHPVLGRSDGLLGAYRIPTPIAHFERVVASEVALTIHTGGHAIAVMIERAELEALNGSFGGRSNFVAGEIVAGGSRHRIGPIALDPEFDQETFDRSYACTDDLRSPVPPQ